jgi:hypothetical protein
MIPLSLKPDFRASIRVWDAKQGNHPPEIFCVCATCFNFWIGTDTFGMHQWMQYHGPTCNAAMMPSDLPEEIKKAWAKVREGQ